MFIAPFVLFSCNTSTDSANSVDQETNSDSLAVGSDIYSGDQYIDRILEMNVDQRQALLRAGHQNFLDLPVSSDIVHSEILPEIRQKRLQMFPDFPERQDSEEASQQALNDWLQNYPQQLAAYLEFLDDQYQQYEYSLR